MTQKDKNQVGKQKDEVVYKNRKKGKEENEINFKM